MKIKDLEQGKYYTTKEYINDKLVRQRWWYISLREDKNIRAMVVEKLWGSPISIHLDFDVWYSDAYFKNLLFEKDSKKYFMESIRELIKELQYLTTSD